MKKFLLIVIIFVELISAPVYVSINYFDDQKRYRNSERYSYIWGHTSSNFIYFIIGASYIQKLDGRMSLFYTDNNKQFTQIEVKIARVYYDGEFYEIKSIIGSSALEKSEYFYGKKSAYIDFDLPPSKFNNYPSRFKIYISGNLFDAGGNSYPFVYDHNVVHGGRVIIMPVFKLIYSMLTIT